MRPPGSATYACRTLFRRKKADIFYSISLPTTLQTSAFHFVCEQVRQILKPFYFWYVKGHLKPLNSYCWSDDSQVLSTSMMCF